MSRRPISVCFPFVGDEVGGSHISAGKLIEALDPHVVRPTVVLHVPGGPVERYFAERGISCITAPVGVPVDRIANGSGRIARACRSAAHALSSVGPLTRFLKSEAFDVIHTNDGRMHVGWALPAKLAGVRQLWHHRGDPDAVGVRLFAPFLANHIVTVSRFAMPQRPIIGVAGRLSVIHSPFDVPRGRSDRAAARVRLIAELGCAPETRFLGYFGILIPRKRPTVFVEAVAAFRRRHPEIPVMGLLFGIPGTESPDHDRIVMQRAHELGIAEHIKIMGFRRPVDPWMQAVDVLLVTATREPFGRTLVEASFLETPVVATRDGGNPEAIEDGVNGVLVELDDPEGFVEPVHRLLVNQKLRQRLVDAAKRRAVASYSVESHVRQITAIYSSMVGRRHGSRPGVRQPIGGWKL